MSTVGMYVDLRAKHVVFYMNGKVPLFGWFYTDQLHIPVRIPRAPHYQLD